MSNGGPMNGACTVRRMARPRKKEPETPFAQRLYEAMAHAKITQDELAKLAGCSQSTIGELYKANGSKYAAQFAAACGVQAQWLATGEGPMLSDQQKLAPGVAELAAEVNALPSKHRQVALAHIRQILDLVNETLQATEESLGSNSAVDAPQAPPSSKRMSGG